MALTANELKALTNLSKTMIEVGAVLNRAAKAGAISDVNEGLDALVPSGRLDSLAGEINADTVIDPAELDALIEQARNDIDVHSRLDGLAQNVTMVIATLRETVLPIIAGAL